MQGWAVNTLGHGRPVILDAIRRQAACLINPSPAYYNQPMVDLAGLLVAHSTFDQVFFANSGAEANEGAVRLARKWGSRHRGGAYKIITFESGFHGRTLGTVRGRGLLLALDTLETDAADLAARAFDDGLLINAPRGNNYASCPR